MGEHSVRREARLRGLRLAIRRLETGRVRVVPSGTRMSISAVAREAGIDPATIHTTYPDIAERIRALMGRETRAQRDAKATALSKSRAVSADLRAEVESLRLQLATVASRYASALITIDQLRALLPPAARKIAGDPK